MKVAFAHSRGLWPLLLTFSTSTSAIAVTSASSDIEQNATTTLPQVEVSSERSGPQLWKLTRGDHTVWILGTLQPLPKRMIWRSREVGAVLAEAQEVIPYHFKVEGIGLFSGIRLYFQFRHIRNLPDGQTLKQVLPPALYARFTALCARYAGGSRDLERLQPVLAVQRLRALAIDRSGLTRAADIQNEVLKLARQRGVKIHQPQLQVPDASSILREAGDVSIATQLICVEPVITALEHDLDTLRSRATAWADGDVRTLVEHPIVDVESACREGAADAPRIRALEQQARDAWTQAVEDALTRDKTALAVQSIDRLLGPTGWLAQFRAAGYAVEGPEFTGRSATRP